jgi:hypothetical protein
VKVFLNFVTDAVFSLGSDKIQNLIKDSRLKPEKVSKMICLPSITRHEGVALHCSATPNPFLTLRWRHNSGRRIGITSQQCHGDNVCHVGPIYGIMKQNQDWLLKHTKLSKEAASKLVIKQYMGAVEQAQRLMEDPDSLDELIDEQTSGSFNEQALGNLDQLGGLTAQDKIMDAVVLRTAAHHITINYGRPF